MRLTAYRLDIRLYGNESRREVLMQLADQTITASTGWVESRAVGAGLSYGSNVTRRRRWPPVPVRCFDSGAVEDEDDQQQTEPTFQVGATVLNCLNQHAGHCRTMLESETSELYTNFAKTSSRKRKTAAVKHRSAPICVYLRPSFRFFISLAVCRLYYRAGPQPRDDLDK